MKIFKNIILVLVWGFLWAVAYFALTWWDSLEDIWKQILIKDIKIKEFQSNKQILINELLLLDKNIIKTRNEKDALKYKYDILRKKGLDYIWFIPKVHASAETQQGIKDEIIVNGHKWDKLEVKRKVIVKEQDNLHDVNDNLRNRVETNWVNMYALALAISKHETASCTKGYWKSNNNCQWVKNWRNCPCTVSKYNSFCQFDTQEESHQHFICVWTKWYWWQLPNLYMAKRYSWNDRAVIWRNNVLQFYKEFNK